MVADEELMVIARRGTSHGRHPDHVVKVGHGALMLSRIPGVPVGLADSWGHPVRNGALGVPTQALRPLAAPIRSDTIPEVKRRKDLTLLLT